MAASAYANGPLPATPQPTLLNALLVPESELRTPGSGAEYSLESYAGGLLILTLRITRITERASLDLSIWGMDGGGIWSAKPLVRFPPRFQCGDSRIQWDPAECPHVQRLRAQWQVESWGPGCAAPRVTMLLRAREVPRLTGSE